MLRSILVFMMIVSLSAMAGHHRSAAAKAEFRRHHPCPVTGKTKGKCDGYVIDHIKPLACGGADAPYNMQWQSIGVAKAKDQWERRACVSGD